MIKLGFAFNFNVQRCEIEVGDEKQIVEEGYKQTSRTVCKTWLKSKFICFRVYLATTRK